MFMLKKCLTALILPPGCWILALLAVLIFWKRRWARKLLLGSLILICLLHSPLVASGLSWLLESRYKPLLDPRNAGPYDAIVTLTGCATAPGGLIPFPRLSESQFHRLEEAYRLYKLNPKPIIVSGGQSEPFTSSEGPNKIVCDYLVRWGVPPEDVIAEPNSRDTFESALAVRKIVQRRGWRRYLLVTSATHMPRSMLVFARLTPEPVPAPGDFTVSRFTWSPLDLMPSVWSSGGILYSLHEYVGILNYRFRLLYDSAPPSP